MESVSQLAKIKGHQICLLAYFAFLKENVGL